MSKTIKEATVVELKAEKLDALERMEYARQVVEAINKELAERAKVDAVPTMDKAPENNEEKTKE